MNVRKTRLMVRRQREAIIMGPRRGSWFFQGTAFPDLFFF